MKRILALIPLMILLTLAVGLAGGDSYRDWLIEKYPMYRSATGRFAPVYSALAQQIVEDYKITSGVCIDMGGGCGSLATELAKTTDLTVYVLDIDPAATRLCGILADEQELTGRVRPIEGDAMDMPFRDDYADLVVSRGSIFFWDDQLAGVKEAYRVLKPGGVAYIGGGFSRLLDKESRDQLVEWRKQNDLSAGGWKPLEDDLVDRAKAAGIEQIRRVDEPDVGGWIEIRK
jgi:SAM-dependent methyltransferase